MIILVCLIVGLFQPAISLQPPLWEWVFLGDGAAAPLTLLFPFPRVGCISSRGEPWAVGRQLCGGHRDEPPVTNGLPSLSLQSQTGTAPAPFSFAFKGVGMAEGWGWWSSKNSRGLWRWDRWNGLHPKAARLCVIWGFSSWFKLLRRFPENWFQLIFFLLASISCF